MDMEKVRANRVVQGIKDMIVNGELTPGARYPSERVLAQRFGVSRNTVREAIQYFVMVGVASVSYTHLDVYKRQGRLHPGAGGSAALFAAAFVRSFPEGGEQTKEPKAFAFGSFLRLNCLGTVLGAGRPAGRWGDRKSVV